MAFGVIRGIVGQSLRPEKRIGQGWTAEVWLYRDASGHQWAVKFPSSAEHQERLKWEAQVLQNIADEWERPFPEEVNSRIPSLPVPRVWWGRGRPGEDVVVVDERFSFTLPTDAALILEYVDSEWAWEHQLQQRGKWNLTFVFFTVYSRLLRVLHERLQVVQGPDRKWDKDFFYDPKSSRFIILDWNLARSRSSFANLKEWDKERQRDIERLVELWWAWAIPAPWHNRYPASLDDSVWEIVTFDWGSAVTKILQKAVFDLHDLDVLRQEFHKLGLFYASVSQHPHIWKQSWEKGEAILEKEGWSNARAELRAGYAFYLADVLLRLAIAAGARGKTEIFIDLARSSIALGKEFEERWRNHFLDWEGWVRSASGPNSLKEAAGKIYGTKIQPEYPPFLSPYGYVWSLHTFWQRFVDELQKITDRSLFTKWRDHGCALLVKMRQGAYQVIARKEREEVPLSLRPLWCLTREWAGMALTEECQSLLEKEPAWIRQWRPAPLRLPESEDEIWEHFIEQLFELHQKLEGSSDVGHSLTLLCRVLPARQLILLDEKWLSVWENERKKLEGVAASSIQDGRTIQYIYSFFSAWFPCVQRLSSTSQRVKARQLISQFEKITQLIDRRIREWNEQVEIWKRTLQPKTAERPRSNLAFSRFPQQGLTPPSEARPPEVPFDKPAIPTSEPQIPKPEFVRWEEWQASPYHLKVMVLNDAQEKGFDNFVSRGGTLLSAVNLILDLIPEVLEKQQHISNQIQNLESKLLTYDTAYNMLQQHGLLKIPQYFESLQEEIGQIRNIVQWHSQQLEELQEKMSHINDSVENAQQAFDNLRAEVEEKKTNKHSRVSAAGFIIIALIIIAASIYKFFIPGTVQESFPPLSPMPTSSPEPTILLSPTPTTLTDVSTDVSPLLSRATLEFADAYKNIPHLIGTERTYLLDLVVTSGLEERSLAFSLEPLQDVELADGAPVQQIEWSGAPVQVRLRITGPEPRLRVYASNWEGEEFTLKAIDPERLQWSPEPPAPWQPGQELRLLTPWYEQNGERQRFASLELPEPWCPVWLEVRHTQEKEEQSASGELCDTSPEALVSWGPYQLRLSVEENSPLEQKAPKQWDLVVELLSPSSPLLWRVPALWRCAGRKDAEYVLRWEIPPSEEDLTTVFANAGPNTIICFAEVASVEGKNEWKKVIVSGWIWEKLNPPTTPTPESGQKPEVFFHPWKPCQEEGALKVKGAYKEEYLQCWQRGTDECRQWTPPDNARMMEDALACDARYVWLPLYISHEGVVENLVPSESK